MNVLAAIASGVGVSGIGAEAELGGEHDAVAKLALRDEFSEHLFAFATGIPVGGVDEIAPGFEVAVEERTRNIFFGAPPPLRSKSHRAKAEWAYQQSGTPERRVFVHSHGESLHLGF